MGIKNVLAKVGSGISNAISKAAVLSPAQLEDIKRKKDQYLLEKPDPNSQESIDLTQKLLGACGVEIHNAYLGQLSTLYSPLDVNTELDREFDVEHNIRYFNITKWVTDKEESSLAKLVNVYEVLSNENCNIALIFNRTLDETKVYLAVVNLDNANRNTTVEEYKDRLLQALKGNFPGTECKILDDGNGKGVVPCLENDKKFSIASVSNIPAEKSEKFISQTIEKLIDGVVPINYSDEYTIILLATPILDISTRKLRLSEYYSGLAPYSTWQTQFGLNESTSNASSAIFGVNLGASAGIQVGKNTSFSKTDSESTSESKGSARPEIVNSANKVVDNINENKIPERIDSSLKEKGIVESMKEATTNVGDNIKEAYNSVKKKGIFSSISDTFSKKDILGIGSLQKILTNFLTISNENRTSTQGSSETHQSGNSTGNSLGANFGVNFARSSISTVTIGKNEAISQNYINYSIKHTLEILEEQMKRLEQSTALGLWDFSAYILSESPTVANNVAHTYLSLTQGEKSYLSNAAINLWRGNLAKEDDSAREIFNYLKQLRHPVFALNPKITDENPTFNIYPTTVTATTFLSGKELAYSLNFPKKSISGLPVIECAEFGRNVSTFNDFKMEDAKFNLGKIFHMLHEENIAVDIIKKSLASHTFITGSTGSGKSNTVYQILNEAIKNNVKFMVVEPTKGEYKDVFCVGEKPVAKVYGTNPDKTPLLRINPFSFPNDIHVFEHMDRLVEIFNVCWPMYAAMPAVLKNAIEKSYEDCGWDLVTSKNKYGENLYPNFSDVARNVKSIIDSSEYDAENKGAYKGALITRLESLTNGINGLIFTDNEIPLNEIFEENVVIDISRVGSNETKSLIMGMMVLKLQEYRMSEHNEMNSNLKHLTVIEEAHNLLKKTSTEVSQDSGNLLGKSVEMISNAIAEMRTYGEGFIIVDQAPGLLDMAAIRNTNTKIIMRLPDEIDRKLVGKAANLNDDQIIELAKLPMGVGAVYQNEWIQPVLCKIHRYNTSGEIYKNQRKVSDYTKNIDELVSVFELLSKSEKISDDNKLKDIIEILRRNNINSSSIALTIKLLKNPPKEPRMSKFAPITASMFPELIETIKKVYSESPEISEWKTEVEDRLQEILNRKIDEQVRMDIILSAFNQYLFLTLGNKNNVYNDIKKELGG